MAYRVGIVGASGISINPPRAAPSAPLADEVYSSHIGCLSIMRGVELAAVCDIRTDALNRFRGNWAARWPNTRTYTNYLDMLDRENLDILTVATPDHLHAQIVIDGACSGLQGILCEKPIATTLDDADAMIDACERNRVALSINHTRRWSPVLHNARDAIRRGRIGPITVMTAVLGGPRAMLFRNGTHFIDALCFFAESKPAKVSALLEDGFDHWDRYRGDGGKLPENEPGATGTILFENGVIALYRGIKGTPTISAFEITGPKGSISFTGDPVIAYLTTTETGSLEPFHTVLRPEQYQVHGMVAAYRELIDIIRRGGESISSPRHARMSLQIMLGFLNSHRQGSRFVDVPG